MNQVSLGSENERSTDASLPVVEQLEEEEAATKEGKKKMAEILTPS